MKIITRSDEIIERSTRDKKLGFSEFMKQPLVRAMLSTLPPSENIEVLLQATFDQGYNTGVASVMIDIVTHMHKKEL